MNFSQLTNRFIPKIQKRNFYTWKGDKLILSISKSKIPDQITLDKKCFYGYFKSFQPRATVLGGIYGFHRGAKLAAEDNSDRVDIGLGGGYGMIIGAICGYFYPITAPAYFIVKVPMYYITGLYLKDEKK